LDKPVYELAADWRKKHRKVRDITQLFDKPVELSSGPLPRMVQKVDPVIDGKRGP
jgi:hypothetical protein